MNKSSLELSTPWIEYNEALICLIEYHITHINTSKGEYYESAKSLSEQFIENCKQNLGVYHVYWDISKFIGSKTTIEKKRWY